MASWMVHFRVADGIIDSIKNVDSEKFIVGNIGPDCGEWDNDKNKFIPEKYITHWKNGQEVLIDKFFMKYLNDCEMNSSKSFYLGYYVHLLTDILWKKLIFTPTKEKYFSKFKSQNEFAYNIKKDWYDLDHMFLKDNPNFRVFDVFNNIKTFPNVYFDYYSNTAFEKQINYISNFYNNYNGNLDREYPYLNKDQCDDFVKLAIEEIKHDLIEKDIIS